MAGGGEEVEVEAAEEGKGDRAAGEEDEESCCRGTW